MFLSCARALVFIFIILNITSVSAQSSEKAYDIIVIGGGIAGLSTVNSLIEKGFSKVLLLEAEERVGGKMWTERTARGPYYERGAELVNTSDIELIQLIQSLGLSLTERRFKNELRNEILLFKERSIQPDGTIVEGNFKAFTPEELFEKMNEFPQDVKVFRTLRDWQNRRNSADKTEIKRINNLLGEMTARSLVESGVYTKLFFEALMQSEFGVGLTEINAEVLMDYMKVTSTENEAGKTKFKIEIIPNADEKFRVKGGTDSIIKSLERKFEKLIRKNSRVEAVEQHSPQSFSVSSRNTQTQASDVFTAKHIVFAVPAYEIGKINIISPELPSARLQQASSLIFGHNAKIFLVFKEKFWNREYEKNKRAFGGVGILESGVQFWDTTENQRVGKEGVITLYPGRWPVEAAAQQARLNQVLAELRQVPGFENLDQHLLRVDLQNWQKSYAGVFNSFFRKAPKLFSQKLGANIYFVGADKDNNTRGQITDSYGYMNGAVRTALRATKNIIDNLIKSKQPVHLRPVSCARFFLNAG